MLDTLLANHRALPEVNILILGETGVGKSTWINGFVNYLTYSTLEEGEEGPDVNLIPSHFTLTDVDSKQVEIHSEPKSDNEVSGAGQSATQMPKSYVFHCGDVSIRIIDTPGIGDVRGIEQDKKNFANIMHHISHLEEIHGICILLKPNESRANVMFQFCIRELLTQLHKDAAKNIAFCFTNARSTFYRPGNTMKTLDAALRKNGDIGITLSQHTMYCVDNESVRFLAAIKSGVQFSDSEKDDYKKSWDKSVLEMNRLMKHIHTLRSHSTTSTISLNRARTLILSLGEPIGTIARNIDDNIAVARDREEEIQLSLQEKEGYMKVLKIPVIDLEQQPLDYPTTVCTSIKCTKTHQLPGTNVVTKEFLQRCHEGCLLRVMVGSYPEPRLQHCAAMCGQACRFCGCLWNYHMHITYSTKKVQKEVVNKVIEKVLQEADNRLVQVQTLLAQIRERVESLENERAQIAKTSSKFAAFLKANAITPYNDALGNYLEYMIRQEEEEIKQGASERTLEGLKKMLRAYNEQVQILEAAIRKAGPDAVILKPEEVEKEVQVLYDLPTQGGTLKQLVENAKSGANKNMVFIEQSYVPQGQNKTSGKKQNFAERVWSAAKNLVSSP